MRRLIGLAIIAVLVFGSPLLVKGSIDGPLQPGFGDYARDYLESTPSPFDPARYGVPYRLAGYRVLAVISAENTRCVPANELRLVVQAVAPDVETFLSGSDGQDLNAAIQKYNHPGKDWMVEIVGPGISLADLEANTAQWNRGMQSGCIRSGPVILPDDTPTAAP
jgi:hypothetical protein